MSNDDESIKNVLCTHIDELYAKLEAQNKRINEINSELDLNGGFEKKAMEENENGL